MEKQQQAPAKKKQQVELPPRMTRGIMQKSKSSGNKENRRVII